MAEVGQGLVDKLYWRRTNGQWHCFQRTADKRGFHSLCGRREIALVRGQHINRPDPQARCGLCDGLEMERRGWEFSGPISVRRSV